MRSRANSLECTRSCVCVQSPCPNYLVGYELRTDLPPRRHLDRQDETFRAFRVNFTTEQLVSSHISRGPAGIEKRANYELIFPQKKKKIPLFSPERNTESFRDFAVLLIHRRFAFLSRAVSQFLIHL